MILSITLYIVLIFILCYFLSGLTYWIKLKKYNQKPLDIKTFEGSNCPYHPSVLYFETAWNGYKYWMIESPYKYGAMPYRDRYECPSLHTSNDGIKWIEITNNPIDDLDAKGVEELDYLSDPHLVFTGNRLECWYRLTKRYGNENNRSDVYLLRKTSQNGVDWSEREVLVSLKKDNNNGLGNMVVSPSIIYKDGIYHMWYVDSESMGERHLSYSTSQDGKIWDKKTNCQLFGKQINPWHIDVALIKGTYYLTCYDFNDITVFQAQDNRNFHFIKTLLKPSTLGSFYGNGLYRATLIFDNSYKLYFSCDDIFSTYIGVMEGNTIDSMKVANTCEKGFRNFSKLLIYKFNVDRRHYGFIIKHFAKKLFK